MNQSAYWGLFSWQVVYSEAPVGSTWFEETHALGPIHIEYLCHCSIDFHDFIA